MTGQTASDAFRGRTVLIMILVGVLAFVGLAVLSVYAPQLSSGDDGGAQPLSKSAVGYGGAVKFFQARGRAVLVSRGPIRADEGLLILTPRASDNPDALERITFAGPRLIVLPKWETAPHPRRAGWVTPVAPLPLRGLNRQLVTPLTTGGVLERRSGSGALTLWRSEPDGSSFRLGETGEVQAIQTLRGPKIEPVVVTQDGAIVVGRLKTTVEDDEGEEVEVWGPYILSDPDLLDTHGLKSLATARVADAMITELAPDGPLIFDATLHGYKRSRNLLTLALEPPFLGGTLCAFAAALLAGLGAAVRFGPIRRPPPPFALGKEALVDNTAGLIRMARREHRMAEGYARLCRSLAARGVGAPRHLDEDELEAFLDRLGDSRGATHRISELMRDARSAGDLSALMAVSRKLYDWRQEMTREHR